MQKTNKLKKLYKEIEKRYKDKHLSYDQKNLYQTIDILYRQSRENYLKLLSPKLCSVEVYAEIWVNNEIGNDIINKSVEKPFELSNPPLEYKASADFVINYPMEFINKIRGDADFNWREMERKLVAMVKERNRFSISKGYKSRVDMALKNYKISNLEYKKFLKSVDQVILDCNQKLSVLPRNNNIELNKRCLIYEIKNFKNTKELLDYFGEKYPILGKNIDKINISSGDYSETNYVKENDSFKISLDKKIKINYQKMDLIHELAHIVSYLEAFKEGKNILKEGRYFREKSAIKIEIKFLKKYFPQLFLAKLENILYNLAQTLFEIEFYQKPSANLGEILAKYFNKCFVGSKEKINRGYLFNKDILYGNFEWLPYAVAYTNVLFDIWKQSSVLSD
jgi:hypothetical protein